MTTEKAKDDEMKAALKELERVARLLKALSASKTLTVDRDRFKQIAAKYLDLKDGDGIALGMEFVLEALHQYSMVSKREEGIKTAYRDMLKAMFDHMATSGDN